MTATFQRAMHAASFTATLFRASTMFFGARYKVTVQEAACKAL